jgi:TRAP-type C4-dicarboxylate transport system permease small subunit
LALHALFMTNPFGKLMMKLLVKFVDKLVKIELAFSAILAFCIGILVFVSATMRYVFGEPLGFSDELVSLMFVLATFFSLPYATRTGINIHLDVLTKTFPKPTQRKLAKVTTFLGFLVVSLFAFYAMEDVMFAYDFDEVSEVAEIPITPVKGLSVFALASMALALLTNLFAGEAVEDSTAKAGQ